MEASAERAQAAVEVMPQGFVGQKLLEPLHVLLILDTFEEVPELVVELRELSDFLADVVERAYEVILLEPLERAVGRKGVVEFTEQAFVIENEAELLLLSVLFEQPVHTSHGLEQAVLLDRF